MGEDWGKDVPFLNSSIWKFTFRVYSRISSGDSLSLLINKTITQTKTSCDPTVSMSLFTCLFLVSMCLQVSMCAVSATLRSTLNPIETQHNSPLKKTEHTVLTFFLVFKSGIDSWVDNDIHSLDKETASPFANEYWNWILRYSFTIAVWTPLRLGLWGFVFSVNMMYTRLFFPFLQVLF